MPWPKKGRRDPMKAFEYASPTSADDAVKDLAGSPTADALYVSPSSLAVPLIALNAEATILGPRGSRTVPVEKLYRVPKSNDDRELTIAPGELLTKVTIPAPGRNGSYEVRQKQSHDWPL